MKPAPLVALGLALNRGKSPYFVLISGRYTSRGRPDHLTPSEHSDRGCGEADSGRRYRAPHGRTAAARQRTSRGGLKAAKAIVPEIRRAGGGAGPPTPRAPRVGRTPTTAPASRPSSKKTARYPVPRPYTPAASPWA